MQRVARITVLLMLLLMGVARGSAQSNERHKFPKSLMGIEVHFRFDKSDLDPTYMNNGQSLSRFAHVIDSLGIHVIDSVVIVSQSSPEGVYEHNMKLSRQRAATMRHTIEGRHPELVGRLSVHPDGESWMQLRNYVLHDPKMKQSTIDKIIDIIDSDVNIGTKKWRLEQQPVYRYLLQTYYPRIRNSVFCIIYFDTPTIEMPMAQLADITHGVYDPSMTPADALEFTSNLPSRPIQNIQSCPTTMLIKTNLVYDALLSPSIELEYRMAPHWSVVADYSIAWWKRTDIHWYYQLMQFNPEVRYWFRADKSWHGHYLGLFIGGGYYDLENGARGYKGEHILSGISYGYMFPIGKRWSLDAGIGVGAMVTEYEEYLPMDGHYVYQQTSRTRYVGPLKLKLSLTWHVDCRKLDKIGQWLKGGKP